MANEIQACHALAVAACVGGEKQGLHTGYKTGDAASALRKECTKETQKRGRNASLVLVRGGRERDEVELDALRQLDNALDDGDRVLRERGERDKSVASFTLQLVDQRRAFQDA